MNNAFRLSSLVRPALPALPVLLLAACATAPGSGESGPSWDSLSTEVQLAEPGEHEVVVVINNNAVLGNHAGIFAGARLSDPAGSYRNVGSQLPDWQHARLADYVAYQMVDGLRIRVYRFTLPEPQFAAVVSRLPEADRALPLFCGAAVQNAIAGIGPFHGIEATWWTSPADLAGLLDSLTGTRHAAGVCLWADGRPCRAETEGR